MGGVHDSYQFPRTSKYGRGHLPYGLTPLAVAASTAGSDSDTVEAMSAGGVQLTVVRQVSVSVNWGSLFRVSL